MVRKIVPLVILLSGIVLGYENCAAPENKLTLASCASGLQKGFADSYHPFLKQKCSGCHNEGFKGKSFGGGNISLAFNDFNLLGEIKIRTFALDSSHQGGANNGPQNLSLVNTARTSWENAVSKYDNCKSSVTGEPPKPQPVLTVDKSIDTSAAPRIVNNTHPQFVAPGLVAADFKTVTWNLANDVPTGSITGAAFTLKVALVDNGLSANDHDYKFVISNPVLVNNSGTNIKVESINLKLNGSQIYDGTTFNVAHSIVGNGQSQDLLAVNSTTSSATMVVNLGKTLAAPYTLGVMFKVLQITSEAPPVINAPVPVPTFSSLFGPGGSIRNSCIGCHGPTVQSGNGFRIDSYAAVVSRVRAGNSTASLLYQRLTNAAAPMPQAGLLPATTTNLVKVWIDAGALNN